MIAETLVLLTLWTGHIRLPEDSNLKMHPLLNTSGTYRVAGIDGELVLVKKSETLDGADLPVEPFRLHRTALVIFALLASLYAFSKKNFIRVMGTWAIAIPTAILLFYATTSIQSDIVFHVLSMVFAALAGGLGMRIILGNQPKGISASLGVAFAVPTTYLILLCSIRLTKITGFSLESIGVLDLLLRTAADSTPFLFPDYSRILLLSMLFGALGSLCDMSADVSSGAQEIVKKSGPESIKGLSRLASHAIGSMTNTLILAYFGGNLMLILSWLALPEPATIFWNRESVAIEVIRAVGGSFGFLITATFCYLFLKKVHNNLIISR